MSLSKPLFCLSCRRKETEVELKKCSRCMFVHYCSKQCQVKDFKDHKTICCLMVDEDLAMERNFGLDNFDYDVLMAFLLLDLGRLDEAEKLIHKWEYCTGPGFCLCSMNLAELCLSFIQLHELERNMVDYEVFKHVLQDCACLPTDPVARLRSTDLAMDRIEQFVIGFDKRLLMKKINDLLNKLSSTGPNGYQFLRDMLNPKKLLNDKDLPHYIRMALRIIERIPEANEIIFEFTEMLAPMKPK